MTFTFLKRSSHQRRLQRPHGGIFRPQVELLEDRRCLSGEYLLVADWGDDKVLRYDGTTGAFVDTFVPRHSGGMNQPYGILFGPDGNGDACRDLYVSIGEFGGPGQLKAVVRYDGVTGAFIDEFTKGGNLLSPRGIIFAPDGNLYVTDRNLQTGLSRIARYDGTTGVYIDDFVAFGSGGFLHSSGLVFGPSVENPHNLDLYASSGNDDSVKRFDGSTGEFLGKFVASGSGGLDKPLGLTFGPDGNLYVSNSSFGQGDIVGDRRGVLRYQGPQGPTPGAFIDVFIPIGSGGLNVPVALIFGPDGNSDGNLDVYVTNTDVRGSATQGRNATVKRYDGMTGAFIDTFVPERSGRLDDAQFLTFTATDPVTLAYTGTPKKGSMAASSVTSGDAALLIAFDVTAVLDDSRLATGGEERLASVQLSGVALYLPPEPLAGSTVARHPAGASLLSDEDMDDVDEVYGDADSDLLIDDDLLTLIALNPEPRTLNPEPSCPPR